MTQDAQIAAIMQRLKTVAEPCSISMGCPTNIVDMGLVDKVEMGGGAVKITMCLTDAGCVHFTGMQHYMRDALTDLDFVHDIEIVQTLEKLWTPDRVQDAA